MDLAWKYKIDITDKNIFDAIGKERGISFPEELKDFILGHNAATPSRYAFMLGADERVFGSVLSFNRDDTEVDTVFQALRTIEDKNLMPFAIDPFGNYICYDLGNGGIVFRDFEADAVLPVRKGLQDFLESLQ